jgi:uncharacterized protein (TIGR03437 family)
MRSWRIFLLAVLAGCCSLTQAATTCGPPYLCIGAGSPSADVQQAFISAYLRNGFNTRVDGPNGNVTKFGSTGLIQTFTGLGGAGTLALIKPDATSANDVAQMLPAMYAYYSTVSVTTAGYPTNDTQVSCNVGFAACNWQLFSNRYALFVYATPVGGSQNYSVSDPFFTKWQSLGGLSGMGPPLSAPTSVTGIGGSAGTVQTFTKGAIYNITSGALTGRLLTVAEPFYDAYVAKGGDAGSLGLPVTDSLTLPNGNQEQAFEGGVLEYNPSTFTVFTPLPVSSVVLAPAGPLQMKVGDTLTVQASVYAADGSVLTDQLVTWKTSSAAVALQPNNFSTVITAKGSGTATVTATAGGISAVLAITVAAQCCQIGQGAPTIAAQSAFQSAVSRVGLTALVRATALVTRAGSGYIQQLVGSGASPDPYLVALPDGVTTAYVVSGPILSQYGAMGGPAGALGYPSSDATAGGRQNFKLGVLAGSPVQAITDGILTKWAGLGYETGAAGSPTSPASAFQTFRGTTGTVQSFQRGLIVSAAIGPLAGKAFFVTGPALAAYNSNGGPGGNLGAPTDDVHLVTGLNQQDFEGGVIRFANGATTAGVTLTPRQPIVVATPTAVIAGGSVHLVVGGFSNGATINVSQTGQPAFVATVPNGTYAWDVLVPAAAPSGVVTVSATDTKTGSSARTTYTVQALTSALVSLKVVSGDRQVGAPGAFLGQPIVVILRDHSGNPLSGFKVSFSASPGAQITPSSATTGADGQATAMLRLPSSGGIALGTAEVGRAVVGFGAQSAAFVIPNVPAFMQGTPTMTSRSSAIQQPQSVPQADALVASAASIVRYYQSLGVVPQPNGLADPSVLNQFLNSFCTSDAQANQICDGFLFLGPQPVANLWRLSAFAGNGLDVQVVSPNSQTVHDLLAGGSPLLVALSLKGLGSHFVVATGIAEDGSLIISDPNPAFGQTDLDGYLNGFTITDGTGASVAVQGTVAGVVQFLPQAPSAAFLVAATAPVAISSTNGACGRALSIPDAAATLTAATFGTLYFQACDGSNGAYEFDIDAAGLYAGIFADLSATGGEIALSGSGAAAAQVVQSNSQWILAPQDIGISAAGVVNAANPASALSPGGLFSIFGTGLSGATVQINGQNATVTSATPFLVNAQIPFGTTPGSAALSVVSNSGAAQQSIAISDVGPAIFTLHSGSAAIQNEDNSLNTSSNPAIRGTSIVIYGTGFGEVAASGAASLAITPVTAVVNGIELPAEAALSTTKTGVYEVTVPLPEALPPGLTLPLFLTQGGATSNVVTVAIQ